MQRFFQNSLEPKTLLQVSIDWLSNTGGQLIPMGVLSLPYFLYVLNFKKYRKIGKPPKLSLYLKKEVCSSLSDWRPISLCNTTAKLFTFCLTKRLIDWATIENVLCPAQKGFMPYDGAFENNYVFSQKLLNAKKNSTDICAASIDLTNAFGSIAHSSLLSAIE